MRKKFYLVQIGVSYSNPVFLPYSTGCIAAYLKRDAEISEHYEIPDIIVMRERPEDVIKRFDTPDIVAFSCYTWNYEYDLLLARMLKEKFPDVLILFGGHSVPQGGDMLDEYPFINFLMHNEGEETTALLLKALANGTPFSEIPNLSYRTPNGTLTTPDRHPCDISGYPSPYLDGIFDNIIKEFPDTEFHATLETNRGCPYECAYCEWCFTKKLRAFPMKKIKAEIEWIAAHKLKYCYCADANFGILDRDVEIAQYVVDMKKKYGYPDVFKPCYAKESDDNVFNAGHILNKNNADKGVTLAYQTLEKTALENIGRKNLTLERFSDLDRRYTEAGIPTYTELILGLPGETCESFCRGLCSLLRAGQNNSMTVYECQVYPNTRMGDPAYREKFGIKMTRIPLLGIHYNPEFNGVYEHFDIIYETNTMPKDDWVRAYMFSVVLQSFHHLGLLRYFAIYLHREKGMAYYDFYNELYNFIYYKNDGFLHTLFTQLSERKSDLSGTRWTYQRDEFSTTGWYFEEGVFLEMVSHFDKFREEILPFVESFGLGKELTGELLNYQFSVIRQLGMNEVTVRSGCNFYRYFEDASETVPLKKKASVLHIVTDKVFDNWADYARNVIWFGKRYSATLMTNPKEHVTYEEEE